MFPSWLTIIKIEYHQTCCLNTIYYNPQKHPVSNQFQGYGNQAVISNNKKWFYLEGSVTANKLQQIYTIKERFHFSKSTSFCQKTIQNDIKNT